MAFNGLAAQGKYDARVSNRDNVAACSACSYCSEFTSDQNSVVFSIPHLITRI